MTIGISIRIGIGSSSMVRAEIGEEVTAWGISWRGRRGTAGETKRYRR